MTFKTTKKNEFKKDPLRGLEYNHDEYKPFPFVQTFVMMLITMTFIAVCFKMCTDKPEVVTTQQLNADRR